MIKKKIGIISITSILTLFTIGCSTKESININVLATTDLHSMVPDELVNYVKGEREKDKDLVLVDAGDFLDSQTEPMAEWFSGERLVSVSKEGMPTYEKIAEPREGIAPIVKDMGNLEYDAVVLGNHEFVSNSKETLDTLIDDFKDHSMEILSANTYKSNGENYTKPYIIKEIETEEGKLNVGVLGLTIKEVGEKMDWDGEKLVPTKSRELKDQIQYEGKLYMNDLVEDANKWVTQMKEDNADVIIAVVHSGEKPKKPKNPGNRIQELAKEVSGIDVIVAGHTHKQVEQHDYENKDGENVIVTQPGKHGECISHINLEVEKVKDDWEVVNKESKIVKFNKE